MKLLSRAKKTFRRTRDVIRKLRPVGKISYEEWQDIQSRHNFAVTFLTDKNPVYNLLTEGLRKAEEVVLENRLHEVREVKKITDNLTKLFITPKQEQLDELVGQVKLINSILNEVKYWKSYKEELERLEGLGKIEIDRGK
jgi:hypothetical protein